MASCRCRRSHAWCTVFTACMRSLPEASTPPGSDSWAAATGASCPPGWSPRHPLHGAVPVSPVTDRYSQSLTGKVGKWGNSFLRADLTEPEAPARTRSPALRAHGARTPCLVVSSVLGGPIMSEHGLGSTVWTDDDERGMRENRPTGGRVPSHCGRTRPSIRHGAASPNRFRGRPRRARRIDIPLFRLADGVSPCGC